MPTERWRRIEELYHEALARPEAARAEWLGAACGGDHELRREVEALVRYDAADARVLEKSALVAAAAAFGRERRDGLVGRRLGGYEVLAFLGAGGMGEVYRARDVRLRREVALKVFEDAGSIGPLARIEAEARAASVLNHPNIVTIYGVGEDGDTAWIAMELVHGRSLRDLLGEAPLVPALALDIARQLAEAIAAAHARGIVHRDLKPENVMITPEGRVKVLDFGIAALDQERRAAEGAGDPESDPGGLVGTVGYISPEQARGQPAGPASDQFAFGVIGHEMLVGRRPFGGATRRETLVALASFDPAPPLAVGPEFGPLADVLARCLAKEPARRYPDAAALLADVLRAGEGLGRARAAAGLSRRGVLALGSLAALGALGGLVAWRVRPGRAGHRSLVVLPFANPAGDDGTEHLCDGVAETLIRQLSRVPDLTVVARASAFAFKGSRDDPRAAGQRLGVSAVLAGSVARRAGRVLIAAELLDSATGARLWGADYDRPAGDVLAVQNEIAQSILEDGLHLSPTRGARARLAQTLTADPAAYGLFLEGVHHLRRATEEDYLEARDLLGHAIERDPRFVLAHVTLASTYSVMAVDGYAAPADAWPESEAHVARALAVDAESPDAHAEAASAAFFYRWDWAEADRQWASAFRLRSEVQSELLSACALQRWACGRGEEALELARAAREVDPLSADAAVREADLLAGLSRLDEAVSSYERVVVDQPEDARARFGLAEALRKQGRFAEALAARRLAHAAAGDGSLARDLDRARGAAGYRAMVRASAAREIERLEARREAGGYVSAFDQARAFVQLGDVGRAFERLVAALDERAAGLTLLKVDAAWDDVRADPRFEAAVARVGIP